MRNDKENLIVELSFGFALKIIEYAELLESKKKFVVANQILKSGTSIGANVHEAQNAESKADFIHKLKIAAKEADETEYWLKLCSAATSYPTPEGLNTDLTSIIKVLSKIIGTSKRNNQSSNPTIIKSSN
ncbi:four helix bundle protein [Ekhidna sp.]|uniref:four helix bundle protein n=1 Tax=Ekhidna sp. TaxID=2608089 RepID=UPI0032EE0AEA